MRVAAIDLGTNSFLCLIAEQDESGQIVALENTVRITRLGEGVHKKRIFSSDALKRAEQTFQLFQERIAVFGATRIQAIATSAARDVMNADALLKLGDKYGIPIEIASGDREARLTFTGATLDEPNKGEVVVLDVGGGSTEIIRARDGVIEYRKSFNIGAVRLTEMFVPHHPVDHQNIHDLIQKIDSEFGELRPLSSGARVLAVAGTPTALACAMQDVEFDEPRVAGYCISSSALHQFRKQMCGMSLDALSHLKGVGPHRADVIVSGTLIIERALEKLKAGEFKVSTRGLRYGLANELLEQK